MKNVQDNTQNIHPLHKDVVRLGTKSVDHYDLNAIEAVAMTLVGILSITAGTIYGTMLF